MELKDKDDAQWRGYTPFSEVNIEAKTDSKWSPRYFRAGLYVASTVFIEYLSKEGVQPGNIFQKGSQKVPFHHTFIIAIIFFFHLSD